MKQTQQRDKGNLMQLLVSAFYGLGASVLSKIDDASKGKRANILGKSKEQEAYDIEKAQAKNVMRAAKWQKVQQKMQQKDQATRAAIRRNTI